MTVTDVQVRKDIHLRSDDVLLSPRHLADLPRNDIYGLSHQAATLARRSIEINSFNVEQWQL